MTIVDSLKAKGSTGGNNIAEAIKNLPEGGGDGSLFIVNIKSSNGTYTADKTFQEIQELSQKGITILGSVANRDDFGKMTGVSGTGGGYYRLVYFKMGNNNKIAIVTYKIASDNTVTKESTSYDLSSLLTS